MQSKTSLPILPIFPILLLITIFLPNTTTLTIKQLNQTCLCDITDSCDNQCCCDVQCTSPQKSLLSIYQKCNDDNFGIPLCNNLNTTDININDLYSGLRTIYTVIKRLFCISRINIIDPTIYYNKISNDNLITNTISQINNTIYTTNTLIPNKYKSLTKYTINGIFYKSQLDICTITNQIYGNIGTNGIQQCRILLVMGDIANNKILNIGHILNNFVGIRVFNISDIADSNGQGSNIANTAVVNGSSCSGTTCYNIVKLLKLYINPLTNQIIPSLSYSIIGNIQNIQSNTYITIRYQYIYLNQDNTYANISNIGYKINTPLQLLKTITNTNGITSYIKISNPINLAYRNINGNCRIVTTQTAQQSFIQLKLGINQYYTCIGDLSMIYNNLKYSFDKIGVMGSSNNILADYINIQWPSISNTITDSNNILFKIYYIKIGDINNPQYYILQAKVQLISNNNSKEKILFIQYQEVVGTTSMYIPPPPIIDAYLPNDFLYPFYVAQ